MIDTLLSREAKGVYEWYHATDAGRSCDNDNMANLVRTDCMIHTLHI